MDSHATLRPPLSQKQPPRPKLMTDFPVMSFSGTNQDILVFTPQKICGQMRPRPLQQVV